MGSTAANTSLLQFCSNDAMIDMAKIGYDKAKDFYHASDITLKKFIQKIKKYSKKCGFAPSPSYYYASSHKDKKIIKRS